MSERVESHAQSGHPISIGYLLYRLSLAFWRKGSLELTDSLLPPSPLSLSLTFPLSLPLPTSLVSFSLPSLPFLDPQTPSEMREMF